MGLGKTLTSIAFSVTLLTNPNITSILKPATAVNSTMSNSKNNLATNSNSRLATEELAIAAAPIGASIPVPLTTATSLLPQRQLIQCILVIAPVNTLHNWIHEFSRWTPSELREDTRVVCVNLLFNTYSGLRLM